MKRYIRATETQDDFKIMLQHYRHRRDFNNADDTELADLLADLNNKGVAHDIYQHKTGGGCTVFYDDITGSASCTVEAASSNNWGRVKKLLEDEFDRGVPDPIFDAGAKVGKKVLPLMDSVQKQLKVDFDGEFYNGDGVVEFVSLGEDPELVTDIIDFQTFYRKLIGMIMEANSVEDFKQRYKTYVSDLINDSGNDDALMSTTRINAATAPRMTDFQLEHLFELADDMLYQIYDNYRYDDYTKKDIIQMVIEHVIMVITEMDDDGVYEELLPFASTNNRQFMKNLKEHLNEMYDTVEWGV